ncbi:polyribonucleotide nucleotidyltransferase [Ferroacidibacillus organovorans]|uniref:polyribonucleotide nucleotidyltransferase n=1 Tax=Ferroacidibacillus organovorans TaxID=1765683 RepID=UPI0009E82202|nr:polyribonucleotide nucleotidyltransferase [Ferroacidibacillus organovorans]
MMVGGRTLAVETGRLAKQANGAVRVQYGDTVVLATVTASKDAKDLDFFPLTVNYEERLYAVGKIPGGFIKREGRPSEKAILASRLIDRPIRPLFPEGFRNDVQVVVLVQSVDQDCAPEIAGMIGVSAALGVSNIPFPNLIAGVIVGRVNGEFVINPTEAQAAISDLHLVVAGTRDAIMMVEAGAKEIPEEGMLEAILFGHEAIKEIVSFLDGFVAEAGVPKMEVRLHQIDEGLKMAVAAFADEPMREAIYTTEKHARAEAIERVMQETQEALLEQYPERAGEIGEILHDVVKDLVRTAIVTDGIRPDGRSLKEIRPISVEVGVLPRTHGSGLFTRGQTQALSVCTLGALGDVQILDGISPEESKRFMHHYNFPPFSTGEARPLRPPSRRDIGHGALGERALEPVIPDAETFPYTIRLVSEVLESNGSSSQASICGSILALMDAGVPIKAPVAGVAMGLVKEGDKVAILTDIQGMEDHLGDMDFKVAGTAAGVTALQMDIKIGGIDRAILETALAHANEGRMHILHEMRAAIEAPRVELSKYAPRIISMKINPDKIREVIGPGGRVINKIIEDTGVKIDIEQDGRVFISTPDAGSGERARALIEGIVRDVMVGETYEGKVMRVEKYGAFVEILPGKEGLVHVSQLGAERVASPEEFVKVGDPLRVKVTEIDSQGRINLSQREVLKDMGIPVAEIAPRPSGGDRPSGGSRSSGGRPSNGRSGEVRSAERGGDARPARRP